MQYRWTLLILVSLAGCGGGSSTDMGGPPPPGCVSTAIVVCTQSGQVQGAIEGSYRAGLATALAALVANDVLLVADLTRLSRSQVLAPLLERLRFRGARVIGVLDGFDSASPQARMQAGLSGLMSDEFRASIRARTHSALEMRAKLNQPTGGRAYGYSSNGEIIETEAAVVGRSSRAPRRGRA